jgi:hypothetical protein
MLQASSPALSKNPLAAETMRKETACDAALLIGATRNGLAKLTHEPRGSFGPCTTIGQRVGHSGDVMSMGDTSNWAKK